ncbi:MAG: hypothetical protein ACTHJL_09865 [Amnibacterium sp.]
MTEPGITVSGGGAAAVDTPAMQAAALRLTALAHELGLLAARITGCLGDPAWALADRPGAVAALERAAEAARRLLGETTDAEHALRLAADRYGAIEGTVTPVQLAAWAAAAATAGAATRLGAVLAGPGVLLLPATAAALVLGASAAAAVTREVVTTGRVDPQVDPAVLADLRRALSSSDDLLRGFALAERPADLLTDDPGSPHGTGSTAAALAGVLQEGGWLTIAADVLPGTVTGPGTLAELGSRTPEARPGAAQLRLERYPMGDGRSRWIVYICGTITFAPSSGAEPFDVGSDVRGVAGRPSDSERAVAAAMRAAGVRPDEPVLLVGHSQGALDAVRIAQRRDFAVRGVVTLGGPTGQLVLPGDVPELSVEHEEDVVPVLGGAAATGAGGLHRLLLRRSVYAGAAPPGPPLVPFAAGAAPHALTEYRRTLALADGSPDPRIAAFESGIRPFLVARDGRIVLVRADRRVRPPRAPRAGGARGR